MRSLMRWRFTRPRYFSMRAPGMNEEGVSSGSGDEQQNKGEEERRTDDSAGEAHVVGRRLGDGRRTETRGERQRNRRFGG